MDRLVGMISTRKICEAPGYTQGDSSTEGYEEVTSPYDTKAEDAMAEGTPGKHENQSLLGGRSYKKTCSFPQCRLGIDGRIYTTPDGLEDQDMIT